MDFAVGQASFVLITVTDALQDPSLRRGNTLWNLMRTTRANSTTGLNSTQVSTCSIPCSTYDEVHPNYAYVHDTARAQGKVKKNKLPVPSDGHTFRIQMDGTFVPVDDEAEPGTMGLINANVVYPRIWQTNVGRPEPADDQPPTWVLQPWLPGVARLTLPTSATTDLIASIGFEAAGQQSSTTARSIQRRVLWADQSHKKRIFFKPQDKRTATIFMDGEGLWVQGPNEAKWRAAGKELQALIDAEIGRDTARATLTDAQDVVRQKIIEAGDDIGGLAAALAEDADVEKAKKDLKDSDEAADKAQEALDRFLLSFGGEEEEEEIGEAVNSKPSDRSGAKTSVDTDQQAVPAQANADPAGQEAQPEMSIPDLGLGSGGAATTTSRLMTNGEKKPKKKSVNIDHERFQRLLALEAQAA
jgi:hypothetical protein